MIPTRVHGVLDYLVGTMLILAGAAWLGANNAAGAVPLVLGAATILYSLVTAYELGAIRVLPMRAHLALDLISGIFLALSPWILGFTDRVWAPHLLAGLLEILVVSLSAHAPVPRRSASQVFKRA